MEKNGYNGGGWWCFQLELVLLWYTNQMGIQFRHCIQGWPTVGGELSLTRKGRWGRLAIVHKEEESSSGGQQLTEVEGGLEWLEGRLVVAGGAERASTDGWFK